MHKRRINIKDIAKALGVSPSTVSRALSNQGRVSKKTKASIMAFAEKWGYRPNPFARNLQKKKSGLIGLILPEFTHHYFAKVLSGINQVINQSEYHLIINVHEGSVEKEKEIVQVLSEMHVDGVLASYARETDNFEHYLSLLEEEIPLVFIDRMCEDLDASYVISDDFDGSRLAIDHLVASGASRVVYLSGPDRLSTTFTRLTGYKEAMKKRGLPHPDHWVLSTNNEDWHVKLESLIREDKIDGVLAYSDYLAFDAVQVIQRLGKKVPEEIAVVGFADEPVASYMTPRLTSVQQPAFLMGQRAAGILLEELRNPSQPVSSIVLPNQLIARDSTVHGDARFYKIG
ncbi:LacI family transcriptional regulator [Reichenbachiella agarivorans]|uniref:LacI family transcriptional regulator n=1 Tax=Reichenbachiella agarivorans TaxID=2979464 RepID=A0ABY6CN91_9BACT|nr:LacI family DNA-binding transcriptional regulator [Reichenbachiella agarivorans]UXP31987.1 LacI family transcriptional regulator [Reichenbachiella agarivorans]